LNGKSLGELDLGYCDYMVIAFVGFYRRGSQDRTILGHFLLYNLRWAM